MTKEPEKIDPSPERLAAAKAVRRGGRRFGWLLGDTLFDRIRVDYSLRFLQEVLHLEHLSYGLWEGEDLTIEGLRAAQSRYSKLLCEWIPSDVKTMLDIGCGTGSKALMLADLGLKVEGLTPDPHQQEVFGRRTGRPCHLVRFELFKTDRSFDLILMSESAQYIALDQLFRVISQHSAGAYVLVADYFRVEDGPGPAGKSGHRLEDFLDEVRRWGFAIQREQDITEETAQTLALGRRYLEDHFEPALEITRDFLASKNLLVKKCGQFVIERMIKYLNKQRQLLDIEEFKRTKKYMVYLFKGQN